MRRVVIVGGSLAGVSAIDAMRSDGFDGDIALVGDEVHLPYERPPLSKELLCGEAALGDLELKSRAWFDENVSQLWLGRRATSLNARDREVLLDNGNVLPYDGLVIATGCAPRLPAMNENVQGVHVLRRLEDCLALRTALRPGSRLVVVGAGFIGLEVAATATKMGVQATIIEMASVPLSRAFGEEVGNWLTDLHAEKGVTIRCGVGVESVDGGPGDYKLHLDDGALVSADSVVAAIGVEPATGWLRNSGIHLSDGVMCDAMCRTSLPGVVAAGDVARWYNPLFDELMRVEHWTNAVEQGAAAGRSLLAEQPEAFAPVPYFWSDQFGTRIQFVGTAHAADAVHVTSSGGNSLVALYRRDGMLSGALCVNATRALVTHQRQILSHAPWAEVV
jgi:NADPH-dependent 2,4-dienoyl-CoA reductase/sulfur reductase-like enzyme